MSGESSNGRLPPQVATVLEAVRLYVEKKVGRLERAAATMQRIELPPIELHPPEVRVEAPTVNLDTSALADAVAEAVAGLTAGLTAELRVLNQRMQVLVELLLAHLAERRRPPTFTLETLPNGDRRLVAEVPGE